MKTAMNAAFCVLCVTSVPVAIPSIDLSQSACPVLPRKRLRMPSEPPANSTSFTVDSGATIHCINDRSLFETEYTSGRLAWLPASRPATMGLVVMTSPD